MIRRLFAVTVVLSCLFAPVAGWAFTAQEANDAVLFFVNDPQEITFADMNLLVERNRLYHQERGTLTDNHVNEFFRAVQEHGVVGAGTGANQVGVAYVVQNAGPETHGVIVLKGKFDQKVVLNTLKKHYQQHSTEHAVAVMKNQSFAKAHGEKPANPFQTVDVTIDGQPAHVFPMPLRNRELVIVTAADHVLISSAPQGNRTLLRKTMAVVTGKVPRKEPKPNSRVVMTFAPTKAEKKQMEKGIWDRYDNQKQDSLSQKKRMKKLGERVRQKVIRNKVEFFVDAMDNMQSGVLTVDRGREGNMTKVATLVTTHESPQAAAEVKKRLMKHMIKEIKRNDNVQDKFALSNVSITTQGNQTVVRCQLKDSKEQLHAFNLISSYVAKGMLERL